MRAKDFLTEDYDPTKARVEHPEDLVMTMGSAGAQQALAAIQQMATNPETISIKPDGKPAIVWGSDQNGFGMADKHMFAKGIIPRSIEQLNQVYASRSGGGREDLMSMMAALWPQFEASVPNSFKGWMFGDLLYNQRPPAQNGQFVFQPNTVVYTVPVDSDLGKQIANSTSAIVAHTYFSQAPYPGPNGKIVATPGRHINSPRGLSTSGPLLVISDQFTVPPKVKIPASVKTLGSFVQRNGGLIDRVLDPNALTSLKIKDLPELLKKYTNNRVRQRNFANFGSDFLEWLSTARVSEQKQKNIATHLQANANGFKVLCQTFIGIMQAKDQIVATLDAHPAPLQAHINNEPGQEGYLVHTKSGPIKAVNRPKFSAANFEH
jgi:hypothetical protein